MKNLLLKDTDKSNYDIEAKKLGAKRIRMFFLSVYVYERGRVPVLFSTHYFNSADNEICYTIEDMKSICGLVILDEPRYWCRELKEHKDYQIIDNF